MSSQRSRSYRTSDDDEDGGADALPSLQYRQQSATHHHPSLLLSNPRMTPPRTNPVDVPATTARLVGGVKSTALLDDDDDDDDDEFDPPIKRDIARFQAVHERVSRTAPPRTVPDVISAMAKLGLTNDQQQPVTLLPEDDDSNIHTATTTSISIPRDIKTRTYHNINTGVAVADEGSVESDAIFDASNGSDGQQAAGKQQQQLSSSSMSRPIGAFLLAPDSDGDVDSVVRRAQESMQSFQRDITAANHMVPEEPVPLACEAQPEEPTLVLKTSRRCLERQHQRPAFQTFCRASMLPNESSASPLQFHSIPCESCSQVLQMVPKSAVVVECPHCHAIGAAAASPPTIKSLSYQSEEREDAEYAC